MSKTKLPFEYFKGQIENAKNFSEAHSGRAGDFKDEALVCSLLFTHGLFNSANAKIAELEAQLAKFEVERADYRSRIIDIRNIVVKFNNGDLSADALIDEVFSTCVSTLTTNSKDVSPECCGDVPCGCG